MNSGLVILTGVSGVIGKILSENLLAEGWDVLGITKTEKSSLKMNKIYKDNPKFKSIAIDLCADKFEEKIEKTLSNSKKIYGIIHNARDISNLKLASSGLTDEKEFINEFSLAITSPYKISMSLKNYGLKRIIFISSQYGIVAPNPNLYMDKLLNSPIQYGVAKAAQIHLVKELAVRLSDENILVNAIALGGIEGRTSNIFKEKYSQCLPIKRMLHDYEIVPAVNFLLDPKNTASNGSTVIVDGGWTIL